MWPYDAVVLAAGRGERLAPLTDTLPKPLAPVNSRPLLEWQILYLRSMGFNPVVTSWWLADKIVSLGRIMDFDVIVEDHLQRPGEVLAELVLLGLLQPQFIVINADTVIPEPPTKLVAKLGGLPPQYGACLLVRPTTNADQDKGVVVPRGGRWLALEKPLQPIPHARVWTGIAALRTEAIGDVRGDSLLEAIRPTAELAVIDTHFAELDIGTWPAYRHAGEAIARHYLPEILKGTGG